MMSMFTKTTSSMARTPRSEDSDDLSTWEIIDNHLSDDDDVYSFDGDDSMCDGPADLVAMLSDGEGDVISDEPDAVDNQLELDDCSGNGYDDVDEEGACASRDLVPVLAAFLSDGGGVISEELDSVSDQELDSVSDQLELGDCSENGDGEVDEEGAWESREVVPVVTGFVVADGDLTGDECFSGFAFPAPLLSEDDMVHMRFAYGEGYGMDEDDDVEEEDDLDDEGYDEEEMMMFKLDGRVGKQRMKKTGKKGATKGKMAKSKRMPYSFNRPGCIYKKGQHAYL